MKICIICEAPHKRAYYTCSTPCSEKYLKQKANSRRHERYKSDTEKPDVAFRNKFLLMPLLG